MVLNAAKLGHSTDTVSAVTQKGKTLLGVKHGIEIPIVSVNFEVICSEIKIDIYRRIKSLCLGWF